jgi:hypothetical protein
MDPLAGSVWKGSSIKILKSDESCIGNPKVETSNWTTTPKDYGPI